MGELPEPTDPSWKHNHAQQFFNYAKQWNNNSNESTYFNDQSGTTIVGGNEEEFVEDEENNIDINFQDDLNAGTYTDKANNSDESVNKNKFITWDNFQVGVIANCDALCYYSGIFCGHGGSECSEYVVKHLKNNILTMFRQTYPTIVEKTQSLSKRKLKRKEGREGAEIQALEISCRKGFQMTDNNYLDYARRNHKQDGSSGCIAFFYGPTEEGLLKLITANVGDSHVILSRKGFPIRLSNEHRPNEENEQKRIKQAGGIVKNDNGIWKVHKNVKNVSQNQHNQGFSISRSFGDYDMKTPQKLLSSEPNIKIISIDFDNDDFLVLISSGIAEFLTDQQIVNIIFEKVKKNCSPKESSKAIIDNVRMKGLTNDATCTVIYFGWRDIYKNVNEKDEEVQNDNDYLNDDDEDIDIFK